MNIKKSTFVFLWILLTVNIAFSQDKPVSEMTREDVLQLEYDTLIEMPLDDLLKLAEIVGVSLNELYDMILNKDVEIASKMEESSFDSPLSTTVLTAEDIKNSGALNIPEALRLVPGIIVRQKTNGNYDVHIRGNDYIPPGEMMAYSDNSLSLVMIDGRPVFNYFAGGTFWESLPIDLNDIEKIEIVRGAASALYGPNAVTGVINIITNKPLNKEFHVQANAQVGTANTQIGNAAIEFGIKKRWKFRISGNYHNRDRFQYSYYSLFDNAYINREDFINKIDSFEKNNNNIGGANLIPDEKHALEKSGINSFIYYDHNEKINVSNNFSFQNSTAQTEYITAPGTFLSFRDAATIANNFNLNIGGFHFQSTLKSGTLTSIREMPGFKYDFTEANSVFEYKFNLKNLIIQPGIGFYNSLYNDANYVDERKRGGFLNGEKTLLSAFGYLRADYRPTENLRLIGAATMGAYKEIQQTYLSYQFIASYKTNENSLIRVVYSQANSSPFMVNTYASYQVPLFRGRVEQEGVRLWGVYEYLGSKELDLVQMDVVEIGFRNKLLKNIYSDFEFFYITGQNFTYVNEYSPTSTFYSDNKELTQEDLNNGMQPDSIFIYQYGQIENSSVKSNQIGITGSLDFMFGSKAKLKLFATLQTTLLNNYTLRDSLTLNELTSLNVDSAYLYNNPAQIDIEHKYTPNIYGGGEFNYAPFKRWNFNTSAYFYSKQQINYTVESIPLKIIDPKFISNLRVSYQFWRDNSIYVNARNMFNTSTKEFAFADDIKGLYLIGLDIRF